MDIAVLGLGKMGMQIARRLHKNKFSVVGWNRSEQPRKDFEACGGRTAATFAALSLAMTVEPRVFWLMVPNNTAEELLFGAEGLVQHLRAGDILIEGGNSFYKDSMRRAKVLQDKGVVFFDSGTSGGVWGEENGFALDIIRNNDIMESAKPKQNQGLLAGDITCALLSSSQG
jgi:6-phosphogluconate dehydrogenase